MHLNYMLRVGEVSQEYSSVDCGVEQPDKTIE